MFRCSRTSSKGCLKIGSIDVLDEWQLSIRSENKMMVDWNFVQLKARLD